MFRNSRKGFSILDLLASIAIISILSSIAISSFNSYQYRAKGAIAKSHLGAILQYEKLFFTEYNAYSSRLDQLGFQVDGQVPFNIGFATDFNNVPPGAPTGSATCKSMCDSSTCARAVCNTTSNWLCTPTSYGDLDGSLYSYASATAFRAEAHAHLEYSTCPPTSIGGVTHTFTIDQNGAFFTNLNGL